MEHYYEELIDDEGYIEGWIVGRKGNLFLILLNDDEEKKKKYVKYVEEKIGSEYTNLFVCVHKESLILNAPPEVFDDNADFE
jgi:hypothetical protein